MRGRNPNLVAPKFEPIVILSRAKNLEGGMVADFRDELRSRHPNFLTS